MNKFLILSLFVLILFSCEKIEEPQILGTYRYQYENCDPAVSPEFNCSSFIVFSEGGNADVLLGGDIVSRTTFKIKGEKIKVQKSDQFGLELEFRYIDSQTIRNEDDNALWKKD